MLRSITNYTFTDIAQVIVQSHPLSGLIIWLGILIHSWQMASSALFATIIATIYASFIKMPYKNIATGIYGYNATLIGIGLIYFFQVTFTSILSINSLLHIISASDCLDS